MCYTKCFGLDFVTSKVVSCQMHYINDVNRLSFMIGPSYRDLFKSICYEMCSIATVAVYNEKKKWLDEIVNIFPNISQWLTCWDARKYHMFPALDALATQISHWLRVVILCSNATQLWLVEAAHDDTSTMLIQIQEFKSFLTQVTSSSGKAPCSLTCKRASRATHICTAKTYSAVFSNKHAHVKP